MLWLLYYCLNYYSFPSHHLITRHRLHEGLWLGFSTRSLPKILTYLTRFRHNKALARSLSQQDSPFLFIPSPGNHTLWFQESPLTSLFCFSAAWFWLLWLKQTPCNVPPLAPRGPCVNVTGAHKQPEEEYEPHQRGNSREAVLSLCYKHKLTQ